METLLASLQKLKCITREYNKQLYTNKLENLGEIHKFLEKHKQLKLTPRRNSEQSYIASKEIELVI